MSNYQGFYAKILPPKCDHSKLSVPSISIEVLGLDHAITKADPAKIKLAGATKQDVLLFANFQYTWLSILLSRVTFNFKEPLLEPPARSSLCSLCAIEAAF